MTKRKEALKKVTQLSQEYGLYDSPKITRVEVIDRTKQADEVLEKVHGVIIGNE